MHNALWQSVLGEIELSIPSSQFAAWFKRTSLLDYNEQVATIGVINVFAKAQLEKSYNATIRDALKKNGVDVPTITYRIESTKKSVISRETTYDAAVSARVNDLIAPVSAPSAATATASAPAANSINPRYTLDNFIVGSSNDLAYAACQAVATNPGNKYNPLFLYGGVGLGKTHLMQAVGNAILRDNPSAKVLYINTETFVKEYVDMIRFKKKSISDKYRSVDVLIVDDMQFIAGKETFNPCSDTHIPNAAFRCMCQVNFNLFLTTFEGKVIYRYIQIVKSQIKIHSLSPFQLLIL